MKELGKHQMRKRTLALFGGWLETVRRAQKISQTEMAQRLGYASRHTYAKMVQSIGETSLEDVIRILEILNLPEEELLGAIRRRT